MRVIIVNFPGANCLQDTCFAIEHCFGVTAEIISYRDTALENYSVDLLIIPGGFTYGDYLRTGALAANTPIMPVIIDLIQKGVPVLAICNGFQILLEAGLVDGALLDNEPYAFQSKVISLSVEQSTNHSFSQYFPKDSIKLPVAHSSGRFFADKETLAMIEGEGMVAFRYADDFSNGSINNIAGIFNRNRNVLAMMPHPERAINSELTGEDGKFILQAMLKL